jgi:hypothetical protein
LCNFQSSRLRGSKLKIPVNKKLNLLKAITMATVNIREKLHHFIDTIEDKKAKAIYTLFENEIDNDALRRNLIKEERAKYLRSEGKSYSWKEVKEMAADKQNRNGL